MGLAAEDVASYRLPGWEPRSYGYHGDDGCIFNGTGRASPFGPTYTTGGELAPAAALLLPQE